MKKTKLMRCVFSTAVLAFALSLSGCGSRVMDFRNAEIVNGKIYKAGADKPFSGKLTNIPDSKFIHAQVGMQPIRTQISTLFATDYGNRLFRTYSLCDVNVLDGLLHGDATCKTAESEILRYQMSFSKGALDGSFALYDLSTDNNKAITATFTDGRIDGKQEIFSLKTHKLISRLQWDKGVLNGSVDGFDENTGNQIESSTYKNGKTEGNIVTYAPDGKLVIHKVTAVEGLKHGLEEQFDANTGKLLLYAQWSNGKKDGQFKQWDADGKLLIDAVYRNDVEVKSESVPASASSAPAGTSIDACVDRWMVAYRKEQGADAMVAQDQLGEWASWCKEGKAPKP